MVAVDIKSTATQYKHGDNKEGAEKSSTLIIVLRELTRNTDLETIWFVLCP